MFLKQILYKCRSKRHPLHHSALEASSDNIRKASNAKMSDQRNFCLEISKNQGLFQNLVLYFEIFLSKDSKPF